MIRAVLGFFIGIVVASISAPASANLIINGSFELTPGVDGQVNGNAFLAMPGQSGNRSWDVWGPASGELPGWMTVVGPGIEVQTQRTIGITPQDGLFYAELRSHPGSQLFAFKQVINVDASLADTIAILSFWHRDRPRGVNGFAVDFNGIELLEVAVNNSASDWTLRSFSVTLLAGANEVLFRSLGTSKKTLGQLFDNVSLDPVAVPAPGTMAMLIAGFAGLVSVRRFSSRIK